MPASTSQPSHGSRVATREHLTLGDLLRQSLWLGVIGFGGGMSVLGAIRHLAVEKRRWLTEREFANTATVAQMLPGGAAANALAHIGLRFRGLVGAIVGYTGFVVPGAAITLGLAWVYVRFGVTPRFEVVLAGFNAGVVGIIGALALQMVRTAVARAWQMAVASGALLLSVGGGAASGEIALLGIAAGLVIDLVVKRARLARVRRAPRKASPPVALPDEGQPLERLEVSRPPPPGEPPRLPAVFPFLPLNLGVVSGLLALGLLFFRTGLGAYGGGFAIIPHLHATVVDGGWITERQFADAVAVGKLTPGPVLLMATFIGYVARGFGGAVVATFTIFAAPFLLVVTLGTWLLRMRSRRAVRAALRGLTPAVVGLMAAAAVTLGATLQRPVEFGIAAASAMTLSRFKVNPVLVLVLAGAVRWGLSAVAGM
jgi:chromate transporter